MVEFLTSAPLGSCLPGKTKSPSQGHLHCHSPTESDLLDAPFTMCFQISSCLGEGALPSVVGSSFTLENPHQHSCLQPLDPLPHRIRKVLTFSCPHNCVQMKKERGRRGCGPPGGLLCYDPSLEGSRLPKLLVRVLHPLYSELHQMTLLSFDSSAEPFISW